MSIVLVTLLLSGLLYISTRPDHVEYDDYRHPTPSSYHIHNHFNIPITLKSSHDGNVSGISQSLNPLEIRPVDVETFNMFASVGTQLHIYNGNGLLLCKTDIKTITRSLHIGMVSSRVLHSLSSQHSIHGGVSHVYLHNMLDIDIIVNNTVVSAKTRIAYSGLSDHQGVIIGTIFTAKPRYEHIDGSCNDVLFRPFKLKVPSTDIYFGIVSHIAQPKFGGVQTSEKFEHNPRATENHQFGERQLTDLSRADRSLNPRATIEYD